MGGGLARSEKVMAGGLAGLGLAGPSSKLARPVATCVPPALCGTVQAGQQGVQPGSEVILVVGPSLYERPEQQLADLHMVDGEGLCACWGVQRA